MYILVMHSFLFPCTHPLSASYCLTGVGLLFQSDPNKEMVVASPPVGGSSAYKAGKYHHLTQP